MIPRLLRFAAALFLAQSAWAATYQATQAGAGSRNGLDLADAWALSDINNSANWSASIATSGKISPGDTLTLNGTFTAQFQTQGPGLSGHPITILFAAGANFTSGAVPWPVGGAINVTHCAYIVVNGDASGGNQGVIQNTTNGTSLANQVDSCGVADVESSNFLIKNLTIKNIYVRDPTAVVGGLVNNDANQFGTGFDEKWNGGTQATNVTAMNLVLSDMCNGVFFDYGPGASAFEISYNTATNINWGAGVGSHGSGSDSLTGVLVHNNNWGTWGKWSSPQAAPRASLHHNGVYCFAEAGGSAMTNVSIYDNIAGPGYDPTQSTAGVFISGNVATIAVYNNIFFGTTAGDNAADGFIFVWIHDGTATDSPLIANNTAVAQGQSGVFVNVYQGNGGTKTKFTVENNLGAGCATLISRFLNTNSSMVADYNIGFNLNASQAYSDSSSSSSSFYTFAQWQVHGFDLHGSAGNPNLNASYVPQPTSSAIDSGLSLSAFFTTDYYGTTRPQGTAWDVGAAESLVPTPPQNLRVTAKQSGVAIGPSI